MFDGGAKDLCRTAAARIHDTTRSLMPGDPPRTTVIRLGRLLVRRNGIVKSFAKRKSQRASIFATVYAVFGPHLTDLKKFEHLLRMSLGTLRFCSPLTLTISYVARFLWQATPIGTLFLKEMNMNAAGNVPGAITASCARNPPAITSHHTNYVTSWPYFPIPPISTSTG
jgi:hypothetical protein